MRIEGQHRVRLVDHRLVAEVDAVEGADRDAARARLGVGQPRHLDLRHQRIASAAAGISSPTRSTETSEPASSTRKGPIAVRRSAAQ